MPPKQADSSPGFLDNIQHPPGLHLPLTRTCKGRTQEHGKEKEVVTIRVVRLGSRRMEREGIRIGTVRRPPRGVPKAEFASRNWYDVWLPNLAPGIETIKLAQGANTPAQWAKFVKRYRAEMKTPENSHLIELLSVLSHQCNFSVGCYCQNEARCHRSILRELLLESGAKMESSTP